MACRRTSQLIRIVGMLSKEGMSGAGTSIPFANVFACADKHIYISQNRTEPPHEPGCQQSAVSKRKTEAQNSDYGILIFRGGSSEEHLNSLNPHKNTLSG